MASTETTLSEVVIHRVKTKYHWPAIQLNFWLLIMLVGSSTILGIFASFISVQTQLEVGIPWYVFSAQCTVPGLGYLGIVGDAGSFFQSVLLIEGRIGTSLIG